VPLNKIPADFDPSKDRPTLDECPKHEMHLSENYFFYCPYCVLLWQLIRIEMLETEATRQE
jgi:hypothetical protein